MQLVVVIRMCLVTLVALKAVIFVVVVGGHKKVLV